MGVLSAVPVAEIKARGSIDNADVLKLRHTCNGDGRITAEDAGIILALNDACPVQDPGWAGWFVETLTDFIVDQTKPEGYLTSDNAAWLVARVASNGRVETRSAMVLVLSVLDRARWVPPSFVRFALDQVKDAILRGGGPLRPGGPEARGTVGEADVGLLRRIVCSFHGDGHLPVTKPEAEVLFGLDAATAGSENHPCWRDLYIKAVANCVLAASGYATPLRELALARHPRLHWRICPALDRLAAGAGVSGVLASYRLQSSEEREIARLTQHKIEIVTRERLVPADAGWLAGRIAGHGPPSPNARALLLVLKAAGAAVHPSLRPSVDSVATAL